MSTTEHIPAEQQTSAEQATSPVGDLLTIIFRHPWRWLLPAIVITGLAGTYAARRPSTWEASQAIVVRNEAATHVDGPGNFRYRDEMKTIEETILEVASSHGVLEGVLRTVGPRDGLEVAGNWPSEKEIRLLRQAFEVTPPHGGEFGKTEVFYLKVRDLQQERAVALVEAAYHELRRAFGEIRNARAESMIAELGQSVAMSQQKLQGVTSRLSEIEQSVGSDLAELRMLNQSVTGGGELSRTLSALQSELRKVRESESEKRAFVALLSKSQKNPQLLVAAPSNWFESQAMLLKLRQGLIEAQLRTATLMGRLTEKHPKVRAARREEGLIRDDIFGELAIAIRGVNAEIEGYVNRQKTLEQQQDEVRQRLDRIAGLRVEYSNLSNQVDHRRALLEEAQRGLSEAQASQIAARSSSLLSRIGLPSIGSDPVGPSQASIVMFGAVGGLMTGLGLVLLTAPRTPFPAEATSHRTPLAGATRREIPSGSNGASHASGQNNQARSKATEERTETAKPRRYAQSA